MAAAAAAAVAARSAQHQRRLATILSTYIDYANSVLFRRHQALQPVSGRRRRGYHHHANRRSVGWIEGCESMNRDVTRAGGEASLTQHHRLSCIGLPPRRIWPAFSSQASSPAHPWPRPLTAPLRLGPRISASSTRRRHPSARALIDEARALDKLGRRARSARRATSRRSQALGAAVAERSPRCCCAGSRAPTRWMPTTRRPRTAPSAAVATAELGDDRNALGHALNVLAAVRWRQGDLDDAEQLFHEALERGTSTTDPRLQVDVMTNLGSLAKHSRRFPRGAPLLPGGARARPPALAARQHPRHAEQPRHRQHGAAAGSTPPRRRSPKRSRSPTRSAASRRASSSR